MNSNGIDDLKKNNITHVTTRNQLHKKCDNIDTINISMDSFDAQWETVLSM